MIWLILVKTVDYMWEEAKRISNINPNIWRQDFAGAWIKTANIVLKVCMDGRFIT